MGTFFSLKTAQIEQLVNDETKLMVTSEFYKNHDFYNFFLGQHDKKVKSAYAQNGRRLKYQQVYHTQKIVEVNKILSRVTWYKGL